jgi:hypothetical protein
MDIYANRYANRGCVEFSDSSVQFSVVTPLCLFPLPTGMLMEYANRGSLDNVLQDMCAHGQAPTDCVLITTAQQLGEALKHLALHGTNSQK